MAFDGEAFGKEIVGAVRAHVDRSLAPILERLKALEEREPVKGECGDPGAQGPQGEPGAPGQDGVGMAGAVIDRAGHLVLTLTDGSTRDLGPVVGKDGKDGAKGDPGTDGADALGFDDMQATYDGVRTITLRFARGDRVKEFAFEVPMVIDRGVYSQGREYSPGDGVTWAGSYWIAQERTREKPDTGKGWRLAVKRGRDGKDAERTAK